MTTELVEQLRRQLGDTREALKKLEQINDDVRFLLEHLEEWRELYPNRWIAVHRRELVAVADSRITLVEKLNRRGVPVREAVVYFLTEARTVLML